MELFQQLNKAIDEEYKHGELPEELLTPLRKVSQNSTEFSGKETIVECLLMQVKGFEPYCDCGCFAEGFNSKDLIKTLAQLGIKVE
ncbi:MAG: hypothetical protein B6I36_00045 [Desulfobacteraceae bacterium 4572_35.1]|nr:MAG: hypothetical protein B6I36_00045 [Desulfobacteraceae bacterium 4572_35.1]